MPHWRTMIEKDFLGAWDLVGADGTTPKDWTLEIKEVKSQLLKTRDNPKGKRRCTITFAGARKQFVANTTNCETLEALYGPDTNGWVGKRVTLYQADVRNPKGSGTIKGIRVRPKAPQGPSERIVERPVDVDMRAQQNEAFGRPASSDEASGFATSDREPGEEG